MSGDKPKLHYFESRGRAEPIRMLFALSDTQYEDIRSSWEQWPEQKKNAPTGVLPYLEAPGEKSVMVQSSAIARYYAKKAGLMGSDDWEYYLVERAIGQIDDLFLEFYKTVVAPEDQKAALKALFQGEKGQQMMACLVKFLKEGGVSSKFYVGNSITLADLMSICLVDTFALHVPELLAKYPELSEHRAHVLAANAKLADWVNKRPESTY